MCLFESFFHEHTRWVVYSGGATFVEGINGYNDDHIDSGESRMGFHDCSSDGLHYPWQ